MVWRRRRRPACQYAGVGDLRGGDGEGPETGYDTGAAPGGFCLRGGHGQPAVAERAEAEAVLANMGTTLVAAVAYENGAVITNVGDSRAYYITEAGITRITKDHSLVETMVDHGDITADEARRHPGRNLITRALGRDTNAACDGYIRPMEQGDFILLCTDGLVNTVTDQEMLFEIVHGGDLDTCLDRLLHISKSQGAPDNVTAVLMQKL